MTGSPLKLFTRPGAVENPLAPRLLIIALSWLMTLAACSTPPATSGLVRYQPREGDQTTFNPVFLTEVDAKPVPIMFPNPGFSYDPKLRGATAEIVLEIAIAADGYVSEATIISADPEVAGMAAAEALRQARFRPALKNGVAVPCRVRITQTFLLR